MPSRHSPVTVQVLAAEPDDPRVREAWETLAAEGSLHYTPAWFAALAPDVGERLIVFLALRADRPAALLPAFVARRPRDAVHHPRRAVLGAGQMIQILAALVPGLPSLIARVAQRPLLGVVDRLLLPGLVFTSPFGYASEVLIAPGDPDPDGAIDALLAAAQAWASAHRLRILAALWLGGPQTRLLAALRRAGYAIGAVRATYRLRVPWSAFDQYLASFHSARRVRLRHEMATFARGGLNVVRVETWSAIEAPAVRLAVALQQRYGERISVETLTRRYRRAAEYLGHAALYLAAYRGTDLVGFVAAFQHNGVLYPKFVGFDYAVSETWFVYFNLVYYRLLEAAMALGIREIYYGPSADAGKLLRGCDIEPVYCGYRALSRGADRLVRWYLPRLHRQTVERTRALLARLDRDPAPLAGWGEAAGVAD